MSTRRSRLCPQRLSLSRELELDSIPLFFSAGRVDADYPDEDLEEGLPFPPPGRFEIGLHGGNVGRVASAELVLQVAHRLRVAEHGLRASRVDPPKHEAP